MLSDIDPELLFKLFARFISPTSLKWIILILTAYQTLSLTWRCLKLIRSVILITLWLIRIGARMWTWARTLNLRMGARKRR
uniref:p-overlapping protein n=1 Tax=Raspberry vein chlorosis virus TaxID=758677 RepID=A0A482PA47_9RHAB|nr:P-overlapping protein [Raspberry vein chlorosis virus]